MKPDHKENLIGSDRVQPVNVNLAFTFANLREAEGLERNANEKHL